MAGQTLSTLATRFRANAISTIRIACVAGVCLAGAGVSTAQASEQDFADAARQFRNGRLAEAYGRFMELANRGDADAARIAIFMHKFGPALYGRYWDVTPHEAKEWEALAKSGKERQDPAVVTSLNRKPTAKAPTGPSARQPVNTERAVQPSASAGPGVVIGERKEL